MSKRKTTVEFIIDAISVHGVKFDYSKVDYSGAPIKVCIICPEHGEFWQKPNCHLNRRGCRKCSRNYRSNNEEFICKSNQIHDNKYDYSKVDYINAQTKVCIICPEHGEFRQSPNNHLAGKGCTKCAGVSKSTTKEFIIEAKLIQGDHYDYSKVDYINAQTKVCIICPEHGEFWQSPNNHLSCQGCPKCKSSKGEKYIQLWLEHNNTVYKQEYRFDDCKDIKQLRFDFYLPNHNILIEYDGIQHFESIDHFGGDKGLRETQRRDTIKNNYCIDNNIKLIRIRYDESIDDVLTSAFN